MKNDHIKLINSAKRKTKDKDLLRLYSQYINFSNRNDNYTTDGKNFSKWLSSEFSNYPIKQEDGEHLIQLVTNDLHLQTSFYMILGQFVTNWR